MRTGKYVGAKDAIRAADDLTDSEEVLTRQEATMRLRERADYLRYIWEAGVRGEKELDAVVASLREAIEVFDDVTDSGVDV